MKIFELDQIKKSIALEADFKKLGNCQKSAFMDFSDCLYDVPHPMQFLFPQFRSDCHIKGGYKQGSDTYSIKIATGSPFGNRGVILIFSAKNGELKFILRDDGYLTTLRTAIAGLIATELLPWKVQNLGIIGSGHLATQLSKLAQLKYPHSRTQIYARNQSKAQNLKSVLCNSVEDLIANCDVVFTATSSTQPIIHHIHKFANQAIIALGSDDEHKSELSLDVYAQADVVLVDSKSQAEKLGDVAKALKSEVIKSDSLLEIGTALKQGVLNNAKTIVAAFSGIGAQDVAMTEFVLARLLGSSA